MGMARMPIWIVALASLAAAPAAAAESGHAREGYPPRKPAELMSGLGNHHHPIAIHSAEGQKFFDQGMTLVYAFNHDEAIRSFRRAAELDPQAVMPLWGIAYALGPNINIDVDPEREQAAFAAVQKALALAKDAPENERAYAEALAKRYSPEPEADLRTLSRDFSDAMRALAKRYPDDLDAATLFAESLMDLNPWKLWTPEGEPAEGTEEIVAVLESVMSRDPNHVGANHYYVHAVEASPHPERALPSAARLEKLVPNAGHLVHMPSHVYMRTGDYAAAARANDVAARVDDAYIASRRPGEIYLAMYSSHNLDFFSSASSMAGRYGDAKKGAERCAALVAPIAKGMPMIEFMLARPVLVDARFQRWSEVLKAAEPADSMPTARAVRHYARGLAHAAQKDAASADQERTAFADEVRRIPADFPWGTLNTATGVLAIAESTLDARIAEAAGDGKSAIEHWRSAVDAQDRLAYDEPPPWYYPVRESLGAALFRAGQKAEAEEVFRADLARNPRSPRSLLGLWESLKAQKKVADAEWLRREYQEARKDADVELRLEDF